MTMGLTEKKTGSERAVERIRHSPIWRRIADEIEDDIRKGIVPAGAALPTVLDLAARFAVNRHTVRQALQSLQTRGLVSIEQGRGTFARRPAFDYRLGRRVRFGDNFAGEENVGNQLVGGFDVEPLGEKDAARLKLAADTPVWCFRTLRHVDGAPFSTAFHRLEKERWPDFDKAFERHNCHFTQALTEYGVTDYLRLSTRLSAVPPTELECALLTIGPNEPLLLSRSVDGSADGQPFHLVSTAFLGARVEFVFEPPT